MHGVKWQAVHFFKQPTGLSRNEPVEMAACLDYEQALESKRFVDVVFSLSSGERQWMLSRALGIALLDLFGYDAISVSSRSLFGAGKTWHGFRQSPLYAWQRLGFRSIGWKRQPQLGGML